MKEILISIQPKWCEMIASGKKTVEVRKTRPKIDTPFKCYIYCTKDKHGWFDFEKKERLDGKAIGEFVCDRIGELEAYKFRDVGFEGLNFQYNPDLCDKSCLSQREIMRYGKRKKVYGWHISDLVIYDKPKELSEFKSYNCGVKFENGYPIPIHEIKRPPQAWCYVIKE